MKTKELTDSKNFRSRKQEYSLSVELVKQLMQEITEDTTGFILYIKD